MFQSFKAFLLQASSPLAGLSSREIPGDADNVSASKCTSTITKDIKPGPVVPLTFWNSPRTDGSTNPTKIAVLTNFC